MKMTIGTMKPGINSECDNKRSGIGFLSAMVILMIMAVTMIVPQTVHAAMTDVTYERVIAHGGGQINGYLTTNSREAVEASISNGYSNIELDLALSSDGKVVAVHDWESQCQSYFGVASTAKVTAEEFSRLMIFEQFHTLTFDDIANILRAHPGVKIITDTKEDNYAILSTIARDYPDVISQVYPQIFSYDEYDQIDQLGYGRIILTLYKMNNINTGTLLNYALSKPHLYGITMNIDLKDNGISTALMNAGIVVYTHTVNDYEATVQNRKIGCFGIYSDTLIPGDFTPFDMKYYPVSNNADGTSLRIFDKEVSDGYLPITIGSTEASADERVRYLIDGQPIKVSDYYGYYYDTFPIKSEGILMPQDLPEGIHNLEIQIIGADGIIIGSRNDYYIRKSGQNVRMVSKIFKYRLEQMKDVPAFADAVRSADPSVVSLLERSFIAKAGTYTYYNNGQLGKYNINGDVLNVRSNYSISLLPLALTGKALNFTSISMDINSRLWLSYNGSMNTLFVGGTSVNFSGTEGQINSPAIIFNNRSYASPDLFGKITGRQTIDVNGIAIILPPGEYADPVLSGQLTETAANLFIG